MLSFTWLTTDASSPTVAQEDCARLRLERFSSVGWRINFGDRTTRALCAAGPRNWNYLPTDLRLPDLYYSRSDSRLRHFSLSGTKAQCESPFNCALEIILLTYFLPARFIAELLPRNPQIGLRRLEGSVYTSKMADACFNDVTVSYALGP